MLLETLENDTSASSNKIKDNAVEDEVLDKQNTQSMHGKMCSTSFRLAACSSIFCPRDMRECMLKQPQQSLLCKYSTKLSFRQSQIKT